MLPPLYEVVDKINENNYLEYKTNCKSCITNKYISFYLFYLKENNILITNGVNFNMSNILPINNSLLEVYNKRLNLNITQFENDIIGIYSTEDCINESINRFFQLLIILDSFNYYFTQFNR